MLSVSGLLDRTMFGPGTLDESAPRRSIYLFVNGATDPFDAALRCPRTACEPRPPTDDDDGPGALWFLNNENVLTLCGGIGRSDAGGRGATAQAP